MKTHKLLWIPRVLAIVFIIFLSLKRNPEKETELKELRQELKWYRLALDSLRRDAKEKRGRFKREKPNQLEEQ